MRDTNGDSNGRFCRLCLSCESSVRDTRTRLPFRGRVCVCLEGSVSQED